MDRMPGMPPTPMALAVVEVATQTAAAMAEPIMPQMNGKWNLRLTPQIAASSIYDYIENTLGMQIITSKRRITVEHATARDEKLLDMGTYGCVVVVVNQTFNAAGLLFEYTQSRHQPDYFCFQDIATRKK